MKMREHGRILAILDVRNSTGCRKGGGTRWYVILVEEKEKGNSKIQC